MRAVTHAEEASSLARASVVVRGALRAYAVGGHARDP